jgi:hypothetical protein
MLSGAPHYETVASGETSFPNHGPDDFNRSIIAGAAAFLRRWPARQLCGMVANAPGSSVAVCPQRIYLSAMTRYCYLLICFFMLHACSAQKRAEKSKQAALEYGMTHAEALAAITDRSEVLVGEFTFPEGQMQAYQYARYGAASLKVPKFYLYFLNDTLVRKSPEEDLRAGAKLALKDHEQYLNDRVEEANRKAERAARMEAEADRKAAQAARKAEQAGKKAAEQSAEAGKRSETSQRKANTTAEHQNKKNKKQSRYDDDEDEW